MGHEERADLEKYAAWCDCLAAMIFKLLVLGQCLATDTGVVGKHTTVFGQQDSQQLYSGNRTHSVPLSKL